MRTPLIALVALLTVVTTLPAAPAGAPDDVTLAVNAPAKLLATHEPFAWTVTLTWAEAMALNATGTPNALDLLAHVATEEGSTYTATWYDLDGDGTLETAFVDEVNGVATDFTLILVGYFWALYEDDVSSESGINQIPLAPGQTIELVYTGYPADL